MFSKNKKKLDSRVRFQNSRFRGQLQQAREYKRRTRTLPQTDWGVFLSKIGLGTWVARLLSLLVLVFLVYIVYIPNFIFIKKINITGTPEATKPAIIALVNSFLDKKLPWPQKNLFLLSTDKLGDYLLESNRGIVKVNTISKKFPNILNIDVAPRINEFVLQTSLSHYTVSNDGLITSQLVVDASSSLPGTLDFIKLKSLDNLSLGQQALTQEKVNFLIALRNKLAESARSEVLNYEITDLQTPDVTAYVEDGFKIFFDFNSDPNETLNRLKILFTQYSSADLKMLSYVDMRFVDKSYICNKNASCVNDINLLNTPPPTATTTPVSN